LSARCPRESKRPKKAPGKTGGKLRGPESIEPNLVLRRSRENVTIVGLVLQLERGAEGWAKRGNSGAAGGGVGGGAPHKYLAGEEVPRDRSEGYLSSAETIQKNWGSALLGRKDTNHGRISQMGNTPGWAFLYAYAKPGT